MDDLGKFKVESPETMSSGTAVGALEVSYLGPLIKLCLISKLAGFFTFSLGIFIGFYIFLRSTFVFFYISNEISTTSAIGETGSMRGGIIRFVFREDLLQF